MKIKYLSLEEIEHRVEMILSLYSKKTGTPLKAPIPIEDILENYISFSLNCAELENGVLGKTCTRTMQVFIDDSLDPGDNPDSIGRYRFTIAHEIGHFVLHWVLAKELRDLSWNQFSDAEKKRLDIQADYFAACLLMPKTLVFEYLEKEQVKEFKPGVMEWKGKKIPISAEIQEGIHLFYVESGLKENFLVSQQALEIRLKELKVPDLKQFVIIRQ